MSGPTLQLNINQTGQAKVESTTRAVEGLVAALRSLPAAAAEVAKLQKALNAPTAGGGGLKGAATDQKALLGELKNLGAQLATSFGSLEDTIKKGWAKAAKAQEAGEASLRTSNRKPRPTFQLPGGAEVDAAWFAKMQVGAERIEQRRLANEARAQERATRAFMKRYEDEARLQRRMQVESAKLAEAQRVAAERESARAEAQAARREAAAARIDARHRANYERELAREAQRIRDLQVNSAKMAEAARTAAEKEAAASARAAEKKELALQQADAKLRAQFEREYAREAQRVRDLQIQSAKMAEAARMAAEKEAGAIRAASERVEAAQRAANAKFAALSERGQAQAIVKARSALDQPGADAADVARRFGAGAVSAAAYIDLATAKQRVGDMAARATPQMKTFGVSMADAHSAARGLASGFGAMYLTWGRIMPLLAGAALSQSFVKSVGIGVGVRQDLETVRVLSQESSTAVKGLEDQLIALGSNGPFGPQQVAEAMKVLSLAGLGAAQVSSALKPALDLAVVGGTTIEKSASALVAVGTAYGYQAESFGLVGDAMSKAAAISMSSVDGMMESFRSASVVGQQYKVSLNDTAAALAVLANVGIRNSAAGTAVRQMYSELSGASRQTRQAMADLGVSVIQTSGGMRPLLDIVRDLDQALSKKSAAAYQRAIQDMSNERGAKSLVALLEAFRDSAKEAGSTVTTELDRIRKAIADAPGFAAISSAQLSATPQKQMESVVSSFQTGLFEAFKAIEPTILVISARLKEIFRGEDFRGLVSSLAVTVGNLSVFLLEHAGLIKNIVIGYALWKGAALGLAAANAAVATATSLVGAYKIAMDRAALSATLAAGGARAAWMAFLGPLGLVLGAVTAAWALYESTSAKASLGGIDAARVRNEVTITSLDAEIERLDKVNKELGKSISLRAAEAAVKGEEERGKTLEGYRQRAAELEPLLHKRQSAFDAEQARLDAGKTTSTSARDAAKAALDRTYGQLLAVYKEADKVGNLVAAKTDEVSAKSARNAELAAENAAKAARKFGSEGITPSGMEQGLADAAARRREAERNRFISIEQKTFNNRLKSVDDFKRRYIAVQDESVRMGAISEEKRDLLVAEMERQSYAERIEAAMAFETSVGVVVARMARSGNENSVALAQQVIESYQDALINSADNLETELKKIKIRFEKNLELTPKITFEPLATATMPAPGDGLLQQWEKDLERFKSTIQVMRDAKQDFMSGFISMGRDMWGEFIRTGKTSSKQFKDLLINTLADISYKRFFAEPLAKLGNQFFDTVLKPQATAGTSENPADSMKYLSSIASGLGDSLSQLGSSFWEMFRMAGQGLAAMMQAAGSTGQGSWGDALASMFNGGGWSANSSTYSPSATGDFARGGAFSAGVQAFARGSAFGSDVLHSPQMFRFGRGGANLGVAGEAGPEAIMPLTRTADGSLGVRAQGDGGGVTNVSVQPKTQVIIEDHSSGAAKPQVTQQRQPNGDEMIRVVIGAVNKDMARGGSTRKTLKQHTTAQSNLPRF